MKLMDSFDGDEGLFGRSDRDWMKRRERKRRREKGKERRDRDRESKKKERKKEKARKRRERKRKDGNAALTKTISSGPLSKGKRGPDFITTKRNVTVLITFHQKGI